MEVRHLRRPFPAATVSFLAHDLCGCPSHPKVASTKILAESEAPRWSCGFFPISRVLAACLLACLLLAKPDRSTLDAKEGYETETGSTSSVTLIKTEYWDRAGGGGNISYDW